MCTMTDVLTPLQLSGLDPAPVSANSNLINLDEVSDVRHVQPASDVLELLQHQSCMQEVILQQFHQINMLKQMMRQVIGEQQRQRCYIQSLESALLHVNVKMCPTPDVTQPATEVPTPTPLPDIDPQISGDDRARRSNHEEVNQASSQDCTEGAQSRSLVLSQRADPAIRRVVELKMASPVKLEKRQTAKETRVVQKLLRVWDRLEVKGGLLMYRKGSKKGARHLIVLPRPLREEMFGSLHGEMERHGYGKILKMVKERYYWPSLHNETMEHMRRHRKRVQRNERGQAVQEVTPRVGQEVRVVPPPLPFRDVCYRQSTIGCG